VVLCWISISMAATRGAQEKEDDEAAPGGGGGPTLIGLGLRATKSRPAMSLTDRCWFVCLKLC
jgi:hypothetical protein